MCRYACAYSTIQKRDWWDITVCGGPIVEQATHFVDLLRFFGGEIIQDSIQAVAVGPKYELSDMPEDPNAEHTVSHFFISSSSVLPKLAGMSRSKYVTQRMLPYQLVCLFWATRATESTGLTLLICGQGRSVHKCLARLELCFLTILCQRAGEFKGAGCGFWDLREVLPETKDKLACLAGAQRQKNQQGYKLYFQVQGWHNWYTVPQPCPA